MEIPGSGSGSGGTGGGAALEVVEFSMLLLLVDRAARGGRGSHHEWPLTPSTHKPSSEPTKHSIEHGNLFPEGLELRDGRSRSPCSLHSQGCVLNVKAWERSSGVRERIWRGKSAMGG